MTLRSRLLLILGLSLTVLWSAASVWMLIDLRHEFRSALDERLAASARMVAGLVVQLPQTSLPAAAPPRRVVDLLSQDGVACEVRLLQGGVLARTHNSPADLGFTGSGYSTRTIQGVNWRSYTLEQDGIRITTADRLDRRTALLQDIVLAAAVPFLIAMAGSLMALWLGVRHGLAPLGPIRKALAERDPTALHRLPDTQVPGELRPLVATINSLLDRIQRAMEHERRFTGDAAHELRTPLTAVKTHIQVARLANGGSVTATALVHAEEGVLRLQHTMEQLLMLARVDGAQSFDGDDEASATEIAGMAIQQLPTNQRGRVRLCAPSALGNPSAPTVLAVTAVRNIIDNALRYSPADKGIVLTLSESGGKVFFTVDDEGPGMSESDRALALQRFWRKGSGHGSGLGLSIVAAIAERYGGTFAMRDRACGGTSVIIGFPVK